MNVNDELRIRHSSKYRRNGKVAQYLESSQPYIWSQDKSIENKHNDHQTRYKVNSWSGGCYKFHIPRFRNRQQLRKWNRKKKKRANDEKTRNCMVKLIKLWRNGAVIKDTKVRLVRTLIFSISHMEQKPGRSDRKREEKLTVYKYYDVGNVCCKYPKTNQLVIPKRNWRRLTSMFRNICQDIEIFRTCNMSHYLGKSNSRTRKSLRNKEPRKIPNAMDWSSYERSLTRFSSNIWG